VRHRARLRCASDPSRENTRALRARRMNLNSDSDSDADGVEGEDVDRPDDACVILAVKQPVKRRKPKKIAQHKKRRGKPPSSVRAAVSTRSVASSRRKRYNSESEEAVSDTESEDDSAGKEGRLQRRAIKRNMNCITDRNELKQFKALPPEKQLLYVPKRTRKQTPVLNIATTTGIANKTYDEARAEDTEDSGSSEHDTDDDEYKEPIPEKLAPILVPPKKRKALTASPSKKRRSLDDILKRVSVPISPPAGPPVTPAAPPTTSPDVPPATPPLKSVPANKPVALAKWRQSEKASKPAIDAVALGRPVHAGKVGMLNVRPAPQSPRQAPPQPSRQTPPPPHRQAEQAPQQPASKVGTLVYYDAWALKGFPDHPLSEKALAEYDRDEFVRKNTTVEPVRVEPVLGALPRSLTEYVREPPQPLPAAHLLPSAPSAWPTLDWKRVPETPRVPSRYWNRGGSALVWPSFPQPPRPRSPPHDRRPFDPRFEPRFGPNSDRRRCFDWRFDRESSHTNRGPRW